MKLDEKLRGILLKYKDIDDKLSSGKISTDEMMNLSKERAKMQDVADLGIIFLDKKAEIQDLNEILKSESDQVMIKEIENEINNLKEDITKMDNDIRIMLLPKDEADEKDAILEIRPAAGGDEAGLFANELLNMYRKFSERNSWKFEIMSLSMNDVGGLKEAVCSISGKSVFSKMKFESGTHRVQRIPATENNGRVHTSNVTVAVLPEAEDVNINVDEKDLKIDVFRSSGPGGQSVNTTDSAIRITHIPTGLVVSQQDEKSQIKNKEKAKKILYAKLYEMERIKLQQEMSDARKSQIGTGGRSEKIRTYNFPQDRISDHRINVSIHGIENVLSDGSIDNIIKQLLQHEQLELLANFNADES